MSKTKIALITGGSRGLGKDAALSIAKKGTDVILTYNTNIDAAQEVVTTIEALGRKAVALQLNVKKTETFSSFFEQVQNTLQSNWETTQFDYLVNNAGFGAHAMSTDTTEETFDNLLMVHYKGVYFLTQKAIPMMAEGGGIVNMSTGLTRFAIPGYGAYAAMKGAIEVYTMYLAKELGTKGIRANIIAPGAIDTDFNKAAFTHNPGIVDYIASNTALGRVRRADDIGSVIAFLCSDDAKWVNNQRLEASGGMFL